MTCILASRDGWMASDRRASFDEWVGPYQIRKIVRVDHCGMLVGVSGLAAVTQMVANATRTCETFEEALQAIHHLQSAREDKKPSQLLVLGKDRLVEVDPSGGIYELEAYQHHWSIGSGSMTAIAYLAGLAKGRDMRIITAEDAVEAIEYVATLNTGVGDGCQVERL